MGLTESMREAGRNEIAAHVRAYMANGEYVFGGFVRDKIAGVPFNDMDIRVNNKASAESLFSSLRKIGYEVYQDTYDSSYTIDNHTKQKVTVKNRNTGISIDLDVLSPMPGYTDADPIDSDTIDADINALKLHKNSSITAACGMSVHIASKNIAEKKFVAFNVGKPGMAKRFRKLKAKGYSVGNYTEDQLYKVTPAHPSVASALAAAGLTGKKETPMNNSNKGMNGFTALMKRSAIAGGYGAVATQATKRTKNALLKVMEKKGMDSATIMVMASLLETEGGTTLIHLMLGMGCIYAPIPGMKDNEHVQKLGEHFVEKGFETGMSSAMDLLAEVIGPALTEALGAVQDGQRVEVPALEGAKQRVAPIPVSVDDLSEAELTAAYERMSARKQASAGLDKEKK